MGFLGIGGAIGRGLGNAGEQLGAASEGLRKSKLEELMDNIRLQQLRLQIQKFQTDMNTPQPYGIIAGPQGSQEGVTYDPKTAKYSHQTILPGYDSAALGKQAETLINTFPEQVRPIVKGVYDSYAAMGKPEEGFKALSNVAGREITGQGFAPKVEISNGVPFGITRLDASGKKTTLTPVSPDWTDDDQRMLDQAIKAYTVGQGEKERLAQVRSAAYAQSRLYGAIDKETGDTAFVNYQTIAKNPGKYGPGSLTQQLKNRIVTFDEINTAMQQLKDALGAMSDQDFSAVGRAQLAYALRSDDPKSALAPFMQSEAAGALNDEQVEYITALVNAQESALALRSLGGQTGASDMLRGAIINLLPSGRTPNKTYANSQIGRVESEINALRKALPKSETLGIQSTTPASKTGPPPKTADDYLKGLNP